MAEKNSVKVYIDGKVITLSGYESEDYLQRVAYYLNNKSDELKAMPGYGRQPADMKSMLLALNIADDYFKAKAQVDAMEQDIESRDQSSYSVRQDLVSAKIQIENLKKEIAKLKGAGTGEY